MNFFLDSDPIGNIYIFFSLKKIICRVKGHLEVWKIACNIACSKDRRTFFRYFQKIVSLFHVIRAYLEKLCYAIMNAQVTSLNTKSSLDGLLEKPKKCKNLSCGVFETRITHFYTSFNSSQREYGNAFPLLFMGGTAARII